MTSQERFLLFQKCLGLWSLAKGIAMLPQARRELHHYDDSVEFFYMIMGSIAAPALLICAGYALLLSKRWFVRLAYRNAIGEKDVSSQAKQRDLLTVLMKCVGLWEMITGVAVIAPGISYAHRHAGGHLPTASLVTNSYVAPLAIVGFGAILFFKTEWAVRLAFWRAQEVQDESTSVNRSIELFVVIQKTIGLWIVVDGVAQLLQALSNIPYYLENPTVPFSFVDTFGLCTVMLAVGICLFFATNFFARLAYSEESSEEQSSTPAPQDSNND
jgi:hypothetical protein